MCPCVDVEPRCRAERTKLLARAQIRSDPRTCAPSASTPPAAAPPWAGGCAPTPGAAAWWLRANTRTRACQTHRQLPSTLLPRSPAHSAVAQRPYSVTAPLLGRLCIAHPRLALPTSIMHCTSPHDALHSTPCARLPAHPCCRAARRRSSPSASAPPRPRRSPTAPARRARCPTTPPRAARCGRSRLPCPQNCEGRVVISAFIHFCKTAISI
jgi:hypothetical protein